MDPWAEDVAKATSGRVRVESLPKVVGTVPGQFDVVRDGLADVALFVPSYTPGKFEGHRADGAALPGRQGIDARRQPRTASSRSTWRSRTSTRASTSSACSPARPCSSTRPRNRFARSKDLQGLKLRSPNPTVSQGLTLLGATPVLKPATEVYELVSSGVLDGGAMTIGDVQSFKLVSLMPKVSSSAAASRRRSSCWRSTPPQWATLSKADQDAIAAVSGEKVARGRRNLLRRVELESLEATRKAGGTIEQLSPAVVEAMKQRMAPIEQSVHDKARKRGVKIPPSS
jgi:TRAP-type C4-dicarboxylate transport system substrate-binding protein